VGRVHRYGQENEVWVYNLVASNTREGAVLERVLKKLDVMRDQMGDDRVYDVIDELLEQVPLLELLERSIDADSGAEAAAETERHLGSQLDQRAQALVDLTKKQSLASHLNLREARELRDASDERRLQPCFIQRFFLLAYQAAGGSVRSSAIHRAPDTAMNRLTTNEAQVFFIGRTPSAILDAARQKRLPVAERYDTPFVFDRQWLFVPDWLKAQRSTNN